MGRKNGTILVLLSIVLFACSPQVAQVVTDPSPISEIQNIRVNQTAEKVELVVEGQQPMIYTTFHLTDPDRFIVDMAGVSLGKFTDKIPVGQAPVQSIFPKAGEGNQVSRLEIELSSPAEANVRTEGTNLIIEVAAAPEKNEAEKTLSEAKTDQAPQSLPPFVSQEEVSLPPAKIVKSIRFDRNEPLQLVITSDGRLSPEVFLLDKDKTRLVIDLPNVKSNSKTKVIPAKDRAVKQVRVGQHPDKLRLVVDLLVPIVYSLHQAGTELRISLQDATSVSTPAQDAGAPEPPSAASVAPSASVDLAAPVIPPVEGIGGTPAPLPDPVLSTASSDPLTKQAVEESPIREPEIQKENSSGRGQGPVKAELPPKNGESSTSRSKRAETTSLPKYTGRKISLDFQDADIANVVRLIADVSNLNVVMGDDIKGKVTLKLVNVPWDQALDIILKMNNLGQVREGNILRIATLENISKQQDQEAKAKETRIRAEDLATRILYVNYGKASQISEPLKKALSARGDITVDDRTNSLIVRDIEKHIDEVERLVKTLDMQTPQVVIEARIVQVSPTFNRSLGIQWGAGFTNTSNGNVIGVSSPSAGSAFGTPTPDFAVNLPAAPNFGGVGFTFGRFTQNPFNLDLRISAGESQGLSRVISTPKVSVLDNQEAKIEQGESIPFSTTSASGTQTTFVDANLSLLVTPHVSPDGGIIMKIKVSKNAAGETRPGASGPSILKKEATTHVLVKDGETTVIGGIFETTNTDSVSGVPFLMDIPVLGWFFKNTTKREDTSELLVFLTPKIVK